MQIGEMKVRLGVDADTFKLKDFASALGQIPFSVAAGIIALSGMSFAIKDMMQDTMALANSLTIFTSITGESGKELERWMSVAEKLGLKSNFVEEAVMNLTKTFQQFKLTGNLPEGYLRALASLGMSFNPNADKFDVLRQAIMKAKGQSGAEALGMLGINPSLIGMQDVLRTGKFNQMAIITLDDQGIKVFHDFQDTISNLGQILKKDFADVLVPSMPIFKDLADALGQIAKVITPVLVHGVGSAESIISGIKRKGFEKYFDDIVAGINSPGNSADELGRYKASMMHMEVTNHIYSTADSQAVASQVNDFMGRFHRKAVSAFNNGVQQ